MRIAAEVCEKTPYEKLPYDFDFTDVLLTGEVIAASPPPTVTDTPASQLLLSAPVLATPKVQVVIDGGNVGVDYTLSCKVTTNLGYERECIGQLKVLST